ncbi:hypothetical protein HF086_008405 [Spodoptera exigua]|uniref:Uncharacterized protein n=1 Tax=Spodoptera exigua TaxID=7107 RepID=A0A922MGK5_SPOEX|nr:hypothetical protein HF086_008405 [Spodoptera exigua]
MKAVIGFVMLMLGVVSTDMAGECDMASFYTELGCTPVARADGGLCPESFTCPDLHPDPTKCYYKGVAYADRSPIPQPLISNPCSQACSCSVFAGEPQFSCAAVDCVETFDNDMQQQCKDAIAQLKTCEVDGKTYREGETYQPKDTQWSVVSDSQSLNVISENAKTKVVRGLNIRNLTASCVFGNTTLIVGDEVTVEDACTKCTCTVPPFVTCMRKNTCDHTN